jgi:hypothetical protein
MLETRSDTLLDSKRAGMILTVDTLDLKYIEYNTAGQC